jgi:hypothetical protein
MDWLALLQHICDRWGIRFEVVDLSTNGEYDPAKEREAYERDFKPRVRALRRATGRPITRLRSHTGTYNVSTPETLAVVEDGRLTWWCHTEPEVHVALERSQASGRLPG